MRNRPVLQMVVVAVIGIVILIPVALIIPWFPTEASTQAANIHTLYDVLLIATVPIAVIVLTVVGFSDLEVPDAARARRRWTDRRSTGTRGSRSCGRSSRRS